MFNGLSSEKVVASDLKSITRWSSCCNWREEYEEMWRGGSRSGRGQKPQSLQCKQGKTSHPKGCLFKFCDWIKDHILCSLISVSSSIKEFDFKPSSEERTPERWIFSLLKSIILGSHILKNQLQLLKSGVNVKLCLHSFRNNADRCWLINSKSKQPNKDWHRFDGSECNPAVLRRPILISHVPLQNAVAQCKEMQQTTSHCS